MIDHCGPFSFQGSQQLLYFSSFPFSPALYISTGSGKSMEAGGGGLGGGSEMKVMGYPKNPWPTK